MKVDLHRYVFYISDIIKLYKIQELVVSLLKQKLWLKKLFKLSNKLILSLALPVTILGTTTSEVRSEFYITSNYGT